MAKVRFKGFGEVDVPVGTSILKAAQQVEAPEGYACGGVCACSTCHVYVLKGAELLSDQEDEEADILVHRGTTNSCTTSSTSSTCCTWSFGPPPRNPRT